MKWIKCGEQLPEYGQEISVYYSFKDKVISATKYGKDSLDGTIWSTEAYGNLDGDMVTHWMPLPDPPEDDE